MKSNQDNNRKNEFISKLAKMTPEDMNAFIRDKGKKPKLVKPFQKVFDYKEE